MRFGGVRPASCASMPRVSNRDGAADVLAGFLQANPEIRVELTIDKGYVDIVARGFHAGVRMGEIVQKDKVDVPHPVTVMAHPI